MSKYMTNAEAKLFYEGRVFPTTKFGDITIVNYRERRSIDVIFNRTSVMRTCTLGQVLTGKLRDRTQASVYGVGILGEHFTKSNGKFTREYEIWSGMIERCYSSEEKFKRYEECSVSELFKNYTLFSEWSFKQNGFYQEGWHLDKDILIKGNKVYSEDTCCFVPVQINSLLNNNRAKRGVLPIGVSKNPKRKTYKSRCSIDGDLVYLGDYLTVDEAFQAYKIARESYVKEVANKWKDQIDPRVYEALINWEVNIND